MFMNLNVESWKEFVVSDYFDVYLSAGDLKLDDCELGNIPLISSGATNNGIVGYIDEKGDGKAQRFKANSITVDMFCNAFYQNHDYYAVSHGRIRLAIYLSPKNYFYLRQCNFNSPVVCALAQIRRDLPIGATPLSFCYRRVRLRVRK